MIKPKSRPLPWILPQIYSPIPPSIFHRCPSTVAPDTKRKPSQGIEEGLWVRCAGGNRRWPCQEARGIRLDVKLQEQNLCGPALVPWVGKTFATALPIHYVNLPFFFSRLFPASLVCFFASSSVLLTQWDLGSHVHLPKHTLLLAYGTVGAAYPLGCGRLARTMPPQSARPHGHGTRVKTRRSLRQLHEGWDGITMLCELL